MKGLRLIGVFLSVVLGLALGLAQEFTLTVLHTNDMHARFEPSKVGSQMLGGYSRLATLIDRHRKSDPNAIVLNAGDTFQGTLYFNVYEGLADAAFMNYVRFDAMAAGNHEFDRGPEVFARFLDRVSFPVLAANLDVSNEPALLGKLMPSSILEVGGEKVGVVGAVTPDLPSISSPGPNVKLKPLVASVQEEIDQLAAKGIDKVIVLSHVGYSDEQQLARDLRGADMIVGGHSHSLLGSFEGFDLPKPLGPYPTVVTHSNGERVLVVQAWEWGKVLGRIQVVFDAFGKVDRWSGGDPIPVVESVAEDPFIASFIAALKKPIEAMQSEIVGELSSDAGFPQGTARTGENSMGNLIADAYLRAVKNSGAKAGFANGGGVRAPLEKGPVTYGQAITVVPFNNTLVLLDLSGAEIRAMLEHGVSKHPEGSGALIHPSAGTRYAVDVRKPAGQRVTEIWIDGERLEIQATYRVVVNSFMASGGDAHEVLKLAQGRRVDTGIVDIDALVEYLKAHRPLEAKLEGRIRVLGL
ncbi:MAG: Trifunctional nucleotide phosphoesterase protein YfkN [Fimbriimonadaceae bacterium]|nr:Trifunctional nucleotide phosphoesterase protein YfkN [Fimbriimonadaceae bacterium]